MKLNNAQIIKRIKLLEEDRRLLIDEEARKSTYTYTIDELPEAIERPDYDFDVTRIRESELLFKVRKLRHILNVANNTAKIDGFEMTIDEALVCLAQLSRHKETLEIMSGRLQKSRELMSFKNSVAITEANYDVKVARARLDEVREEIQSLQLAIDTANFEYYTEVDDVLLS